MWKPKFLRYKFGKTFWATIVTEIFERGAWYGFFAVAPLYLVGAQSEGALGLTHAQKGAILGIVPFFLYIFPVIAGTIGDKVGYKKVLMTSFAMLSLAYFLLSFATSFYSFFFLFLFVALGAGTFKPMVTATVAKVTRGDAEKSSTGFGVFYMVVNLGGFIGPIIGAMLRPSLDSEGHLLGGSWKYVFYASAIYMALMFVFAYFFYKEPPRDEQAASASLGKKFKEMFTDLRDMRLSILLLILVGFWATFLQFFFNMPSWITEWVDTSWLVNTLGFSGSFVNNGQLKAEMVINLNALVDILLAVYVSSKIAKLNLLKVINTGVLVLTAAMLAFAFTSVFSGGAHALLILLSMIAIFTIGEILSSPRVNELMGRIAPEGKVGTYQGYGFLSVAGGFFLAGSLSALYSLADKTQMYKDVLVQQFGVSVDSLQKLGLNEVGSMLQHHGVDLHALDQTLWNTHHPYIIWIIYAGVGIATVLLLMLYRKFVPSLQKQGH